MAVTWPRESLGLGAYGIEVDDARYWLARMSATLLALARTQAGWVAQVEDLPLACGLAERVAEDIDFADLLFKRQYGLRAFPNEMARDSQIVPAWVDRLDAAPSALACIVAVYRVVKPRILAEFQSYRARTAPNADGPTLRQIEVIAPELQEQLAWGAATVASISRFEPETLIQASNWAMELEQEVIASRGFFGETTQSDGLLWRNRETVLSDAPVLRELAAVVYRGYDLPWDAILGIGKHLGDFGRYVCTHSAPAPVSVLSPHAAGALPDQLRELADLLDAYATGTSDPDASVMASARVIAAHARMWADRLAGASGGARGRRAD